ncbi:hypothetical protein CYMTET_39864 [Cymbomonas tetramitiformis]|uniref:Uncharacterized protein n=1 Tax=Cymbomonas tetramitiformis TaxID=36881 RepID=A0AAE0CAZ8_9CHLO|nr:hypothetical protein CYMTET_39864 [Cymbomonas tetramitiformis]
MRPEVCWEDNDAWYPCTITSVLGDQCHEASDDDGEEDLDLRSETFRPLPPQRSEGEPEERDSALGDRWRAQLGEHPDTGLAITARQAALAKSTQGNCWPKAFRGLPWLLAAEELLLLHMGSLLWRGTEAAGSMQPHLLAISETTTRTSGVTSLSKAVQWLVPLPASHMDPERWGAHPPQAAVKTSSARPGEDMMCREI